MSFPCLKSLRHFSVCLSGAAVLLVSLGCGPDAEPEARKPEPATVSISKTTGDSAKRDNDTAKSNIPVPDVKPEFNEIAAKSGISFTFFSDTIPNRFFLPEVMGGGAGWLDFDRDGSQDLYLANGDYLEQQPEGQPDHTSQFFRNRGNRAFENATADSHLAYKGYGQGVAIADYDADGFPDVFQSCYGSNVLFHNNGDGTFTNVTAEAGVADNLWGSSSLWMDVDDDRDVDLFVVNYLLVTRENTKICNYDGKPGFCGPGSYDAAPDRVFINQGDGTFVDRCDELGLSAERGKGLAIIAVDLDEDQRSEIYVANDMMEKFLFTRSATYDALLADPGNRRLYANVATLAGCAVSDTGMYEASMGLACADFDGDQKLDLYLTHYYAAKNTLYRNLGNLTFRDDSKRTRVAATSWEFLGFGTIALDYDRDRFTDIFVTNGHVLGPLHSPNEMRPLLLRNANGRSVDDISSYAGDYFKDLWLGRGAAGGDFDNDGDLDIAVTHLDRPFALLQNDTKTNRNYIGLLLETEDRVPPTGARIVVTAAGRMTTIPVFAGGSYLCCSDERILVGLGTGTEATVKIYWPGGAVDDLEIREVNQYWRVRPGRKPEPIHY